MSVVVGLARIGSSPGEVGFPRSLMAAAGDAADGDVGAGAGVDAAGVPSVVDAVEVADVAEVAVVAADVGAVVEPDAAAAGPVPNSLAAGPEPAPASLPSARSSPSQ